jgi:Protein of unknown function (DUF3618)
MNDARQATDVEETSGGDDAARLEAEIAATRQEMTGTVEAIGDRLSPSSILDEAKDTVRNATVGRVEDMTSTATETLSGATSTVQDTGSGILETIKQNPVPAAIAGIGIAWLWTHRAPSQTASAYGRSNVRARDDWDRGYNSAGVREGSTTDAIGDKLGDAADSVGRRVSGVGDAVARVPDQVGGNAEGVTRQAQRLIEESPLAVGAAAIAVGAAIAMVLPVSQMERRVLGPAAGQVIGSVESTATDALQKVKEGSPS